MSEHTKEPWRLGKTSSVVADEPVIGMNGSDAVEYYGGHLICESVVPSNARRIVACVNACTGMKDPEAEIAALRAEVATPVLVATNRLADSLTDARAQRDELLAVAKAVVSEYPYGQRQRIEMDNLRSAIANAEKRGLDAGDKSL